MKRKQPKREVVTAAGDIMGVTKTPPRCGNSRGHDTEGVASMPDSPYRTCSECGAKISERSKGLCRRCSGARVGRMTTLDKNICQACGRDFQPRHAEQPYCSWACYLEKKETPKGADHHSWKGDDVGYWGKRGRTQKAIQGVRPCAVCGKPNSDRHHINRDIDDNRPENIRFLCRKHHAQTHASEGDVVHGERNGQAKLTADQVREIRRQISAGRTDLEIAQDFPVTDSAIYSIRLGHSWRKTQ